MEAGLEALTGRIEERELEKEMRSSYLDYAMSVIVGRALPDVRDGLKPVHRRGLFPLHHPRPPAGGGPPGPPPRPPRHRDAAGDRGGDRRLRSQLRRAGPGATAAA